MAESTGNNPTSILIEKIYHIVDKFDRAGIYTIDEKLECVKNLLIMFDQEQRMRILLDVQEGLIRMQTYIRKP